MSEVTHSDETEATIKHLQILYEHSLLFRKQFPKLVS